MTIAFNPTSDQNSDTNPRNDAGFSSDRPLKVSHIRACTNCVRAKARCSIGVDVGRKCERCQRMNKNCQPSPPMRKRGAMKTSSSVISKVREKPAGLVTLSKHARQGTPGIPKAASVNSLLGASVLSNNGSSFGSGATSSVDSRDSAYNSSLTNGRAFPESHPSLPASPPSDIQANSQHLLPLALEPSPEDAESYLYRFRTDFVKSLPFIVILPSVTAQQLRKQRPFLWVCIMAVASTNTTEQIALSKEVRGIFGREAFIEGSRSIDLLLAILVYAAWGQSLFCEKSILIRLVQFAIAILYDLGLESPASRDVGAMLAHDLKGAEKPSRLLRTPTTEERRALLGCFLMSSVASGCFRKGNALRWTAYSDECLYVIETQKELASDALLVQLVKLRIISEKAINLPWSGASAQVDNFLVPPAMFYLKSLEAQLHDFKSKIPSELMQNETLQLEIYNTELRIHEIGFSQTAYTFTGHYNGRLECLYSCLNAIKSWVDIFLHIRPAQYFGFSTLIYSNMACCLINICRLSTFEHPEWDRGLVRQHLDVPLLLEKAEKNFRQVKEEAGLDLGGSSDIDRFNVAASKLQLIKMSWDATITGSTLAQPGIGQGDEMIDFPMEFLDDDWLRELFGPPNE